MRRPAAPRADGNQCLGPDLGHQNGASTHAGPAQRAYRAAVLGGGVRARLGGTPYALSKFAVEGLSEGLSYEVAPFGIKVTIVEPGPFRTDFAGRSIRWAEPMPEYAPIFAEERERFQAQDGAQPGDPARAAAAILRAVAMDEPPLRLPLGPEAFAGIRATLTQRLADLDELEPWAADTGFR
ncbi:short chain dehydrogenase [Nocardia africana]|uniref:Short chain dehydrogenase n=1 Tax=Nocardia africana TaxID=134964 RepID=A0A378WPN0_9NOCA|nr:SDR family NAD(P)-dependent oxidoreductase [Nocardia africana]SUA42872.1 short chain dehydrogenase [Nocardia africana]